MLQLSVGWSAVRSIVEGNRNNGFLQKFSFHLTSSRRILYNVQQGWRQYSRAMMVDCVGGGGWLVG